ncbi:restriction endonuclease [uncultured Microbacterium sp.]|uniref:restriction endonuclease n=1 Tax=uncultured Microbacterium sp. TaxID=191216 RepID=UPI00262208CE|nr:restriction endonuclease [uncultured Microbacterium sp.]
MTFSWRMAEELAAAYMREIGFADAATTRASVDGGLDVIASKAAAQVKHQSAPVGAPAVQQLKGAGWRYTHLLFFSSSGFTALAQAAANDGGIALFAFDELNSVSPLNAVAERLPELLRVLDVEADCRARDEGAWIRSMAWGPVALRRVDGSLAKFPDPVMTTSEYELGRIVPDRHEFLRLHEFVKDGRYRRDSEIDELRQRAEEALESSPDETMLFLAEGDRLRTENLLDFESEIGAMVPDVAALRELLHRETRQRLDALGREPGPYTFADALTDRLDLV